MANRDLLTVITDKIEKMTVQELAQSEHLLERALELYKLQNKQDNHLTSSGGKDLPDDLKLRMEAILQKLDSLNPVENSPTKVVVRAGGTVADAAIKTVEQSEKTGLSLYNKIRALESRLAQLENR